ncbi:tetratricopeptide repeat protein [Actinoplanes sp. Pm04-4]|uniref:Tetratricopeptide repeat protein n=1 Tax=Paractinoplanes pyxinae TaxID=2997416 RepID=A0ABT4AXX4_9ACTN|nr:tetratricopeptide repeat protein [Actinoplanes pyxinae]MCY1139101.1 tetratricopeptide repeat protein [Actinoplanes pyxinae]
MSSSGGRGDDYEVDVVGGQGVQIGSGNVQNVVGVDPSGLPPPQTVGAGVTVHNLPAASAVFLGRDLRVLADQLGGDDVGVVVGQAGAVHGLGGIGKSELVNHYARGYLARYSLVWWITADSSENLGLGLAALTRRLHPVATLADAQAFAVGWLQANTGWLLVLDNVEDVNDIADLLGVVGANGQVLVTTRRDLGAARWAVLGLTPFRLGVLARAASVELLTRLTGRSADGAERLAVDLGDLPLALEQAAAYISQHDRMSFDDYRTLLSGQFARVAGSSGFGGKDDRAVASVWTLTMAAVTAESALAARVLDVLAWLAPDDLPEKVLFLAAEDPADVDDALALLTSYSMVSRADRMVSVHRLVQAVTRQSLEDAGAAEAVQQQVAWLLNRAIPDDPMNNVRGWPLWAALLPHIDAFTASLAEDHQVVDILRVLNHAATYRQYQGQGAAAIDQYEGVLADRRRLLGDDDTDTLATRHSLAVALREAGQLEEAIDKFESVLADERRLLGDDHTLTLITRNQLASAYLGAKRLDEVIGEYSRVLTAQRRLLGDHHLDTLITRLNLAGAYLDDGRPDEAIDEFEEVLAEQRALLGEDHPYSLTTRTQLAGAYQAAGRLDEAIDQLENVLADQRTLVGEKHPHTLITRHNLAVAHLKAGRLDEAIGELENVLADERALLGDDHPQTLITRNNLAAARQEAQRRGEN